MRRSRIVVALAFGVGLAFSSAQAQNASSANFELRNGTLSGGGAVDLQSTNPASGIGSVGTTIGQSSPIGSGPMVGPTSGTTLEGGFWPTVVAVPEPASTFALLATAGALGLLRMRRRGRA